MVVREYQFIVGPETATLPTAGTPSASTDYLTLGYANANYGSVYNRGNALRWIDAIANAATQDFEFNLEVYKFASGLAQELWATISVPTTYTAGEQISMLLSMYSPSTSNTILLQATSYLIKGSTTAVSSTANSYNSTNSALTNATTANKLRQTTLDLTNASGEINGVAVAAGDMIKVKLFRGTDTDTADIRLLPGMAEVNLT